MKTDDYELVFEYDTKEELETYLKLAQEVDEKRRYSKENYNIVTSRIKTEASKDYGEDLNFINLEYKFVDAKRKVDKVSSATYRAYASTFKKLIEYFYKKEISNISIEDYEDFRDFLTKKHNLKNKTINNHITYTNKFLKFAVGRKLIKENNLEGIENKGKDALIVPNVSSWLMFVNPPDLYEKIKRNDRRTFIIQPNPINGSLKSQIINKEYGGEFNYFRECLYGEIENFIHIISLATGKVRTPLELRTAAHKSYFSETNYSLTDINQFNDIFLNKSSKKKFIEFLEELKTLNDISEQKLERMKFYLQTGFYFQEMLQDLFNICQQHQVANIKSRDKSRVIIKALKDELIKDDHELFNLDTSFTYKRVKRRVKHSNCIRVKDTTREEQKEINQTIKSFYIQNLAA